MTMMGAIVICLLVLLIAMGYLAWKWLNQKQKLEDLLNHTNQKLEQLQIHFGRFTPSEVIESLTDSSGQYRAEMRSVTVLFADLRGFTKMCSLLDPEKIVSIINGYFRCMSEAISEHHGQVTELTGDGILALFGALSNNPWQERDAVMGALRMREALVQYNQELVDRNLPELSFGVGIHSGEVLAGVMGNRELSKFGVVGDPINMAARIESLTRLHACDILVSDSVASKLDERFHLIEQAPEIVKGISTPISTFYVQKMES